MGDRPAANERDDLHVGVAVRGETGLRGDGIVVPHPDRAPAHPGGVVVTGEAEVMACVQPAVVGVAETGERSDIDHGVVHLGGVLPPE